MSLEYITEKTNEKIKSLETEFNKLSNYRLLLLVLMMVGLYFSSQVNFYFLALVFVFFIALFYFLVKQHQNVENNLVLAKAKKEVIQNEKSIIKGSGSQYYNGNEYINEKADFSSDLDIFGDFSLFQYLNRSKTIRGIKKLKDQLVKNNKISISHAQQAIQELIEKEEWTFDYQASLFNINEEQIMEISKLEKLPEIGNLKFENFFKLYIFLAPILWAIVLYLCYLNPSNSYFFILGFMALNFGLTRINSKLTDSIFDNIGSVSKPLLSFQNTADLIIKDSWTSDFLKRAQEEMPKSSENNPITAFYYISRRLELRKNKFASFFIYLLFPYDIKQYFSLKKWTNKNPDFFRHLFESIAKFELAISLYSIKRMNKDFILPIINESSSVFLDAKNLGHPLIPEKDRVGNDFKLNQNNRISIITGSNMSGKSTFLRTLGINVILAYAGTVVPAYSFELSKRIKLMTYMRITDSLQQNVSTFKAEINRVKKILDAINSGDPHYLFLIDEMLRGTNHDDKLKGTLALIRKLAESNTYALIATHDLRATELQTEYPEIIKNYYFEYGLNENELSFDYKIKNGICQSFNASELLKRIGLDID